MGDQREELYAAQKAERKATFDTLERLSKERPELGLTGYFARGTDGVDVDAVVRALHRLTRSAAGGVEADIVERCARIAENMSTPDKQLLSLPPERLARLMCHSIALAIRSGLFDSEAMTPTPPVQS